MYEVEYVALSHSGRIRRINQDNFYVNGFYKKNAQHPEAYFEGSNSTGKFLAAVCDGMGGEEMGEIASLLAVQVIAEMDKATEKISLWERNRADFLSDITRMANQTICNRMKEEGKTMGSTLSMLEFCGNKVRACNLGDSRIYQLTNKELKKISTDHTVIQRLLQHGQITSEEAKNHPMQHRITQYLGIPMEEMILEPAITGWIPLVRDDIFVICSDGLTDMLSEKQIADCLLEETTLCRQGIKLQQSALHAGGNDNITVILIKVGRSITLLERWKEKFCN